MLRGNLSKGALWMMVMVISWTGHVDTGIIVDTRQTRGRVMLAIDGVSRHSKRFQSVVINHFRCIVIVAVGNRAMVSKVTWRRRLVFVA